MSEMTSDEAKAQREQLERFNAWAASEGTMELPVQLSTYMRPEQERRIQWLKDRVSALVSREASRKRHVVAEMMIGGHVGRVVDETSTWPSTLSVLEAGCSWGYVLGEIGALDVFRDPSVYRARLIGVDVNPELVQLASLLNRNATFAVVDLVAGPLPACDIALVPEVLEHVQPEEVDLVLANVFEAARLQVLVTLPMEEHAAENSKHRWRADLNPWWAVERFGEHAMSFGFRPALIRMDDDWLLMDAWKG